MSRAPFLLVDAGNSRIKWALAQADGTQAHTGAFGHADDAAGWSALPPPTGAWISNVAGETVARRIDSLIDAHWPGLPRTVVRARASQCGVSNGYAEPGALGSDRWAGMIGARAAFPDEPLLIATFGTATTLEALRADGRFVGGLIAPGWSLMMRSLGEHTAQLPVLDARAAQTLPAGLVFATGTPRSIAAGCTLAQAALVERAWADLRDDWRAPVRLVVSGGAADAVTTVLKVPHTRHDALVLAGLARIAREEANAEPG
ncbi:pantothenate kinase [Burkholderia sp. WAC0059]|uniref:type III pantothenate kinase n=1 Tax=Burkholderia sp. WAC0059 TaxID=2066022 RepID=UPI000C7F6F69|nr:type III pantothenate kinase [Burkholderia sp. WAC0059]PLZ03477.1 pantothenate kinase [Burkholderia sp. WAC0059]